LLALLPLLAAALEHRGPKSGAPLQHLLTDIDESVRKTGGDTEVVFATLYTYDQQLKDSLEREIKSANTTVDKLVAMRNGFYTEIHKSKTQLKNLEVGAVKAAHNATRMQAGVTKFGKRFDNLKDHVKMLVGLLQNAAVTPDGGLATPEAPDSSGQPTMVYGFVRGLLQANKALKPKFRDVFLAWVPEKQGSSERIHMTPQLLGRTVAALKTIETQVSSQKAQSLVQLVSKQQNFAELSTAAQINSAQRYGLMAETEQEADELSLSITFMEAVLKLDQELNNRLQASMKSKAVVVEGVRNSRKTQLKILKDLMDLLGGKYTIKDVATKKVNPSFLQVQQSQSPPAAPHTLQFDIENALHNGQDTHGILLRIKGILDQVEPTDTTSVQAVVAKMGNVLRELDGEQMRAVEAKQHCMSEKLHHGEQEHSLKANLVVMNSAQEHVKGAIRAAKNSLKRIGAKTEALKGLASDFTHTVTQGMTTLADQSNDRVTIAAAVQKAGELVGQSMAATALLNQMHQEMMHQEEQERSYRSEEAAFRSSFQAYVKNFLQLLRESRNHYDASVAALELYMSEVSGDASAQADVLASSTELGKQSRDLCDSILRFYDQRSKRRQDLTNSLKEALPRMTELR